MCIRDRISDLRDARAEVRSGAHGRAELLIATDEECRQRVRKLRVARDTWEPEVAERRAAQCRRRAPDRPAGIADAQFIEHSRRNRALVIGGERVGRRVLWAKRTRRDAAAIRERRDWDEVFVETGQAREHLIAIRWKAMIDPEAELVLID